MGAIICYVTFIARFEMGIAQVFQRSEKNSVFLASYRHIFCCVKSRFSIIIEYFRALSQIESKLHAIWRYILWKSQPSMKLKLFVDYWMIHFYGLILVEIV